MGSKYMIMAGHYPSKGYYEESMQTNWFVVHLVQLAWIMFVKKCEIINTQIRRID